MKKVYTTTFWPVCASCGSIIPADTYDEDYFYDGYGEVAGTVTLEGAMCPECNDQEVR